MERIGFAATQDRQWRDERQEHRRKPKFLALGNKKGGWRIIFVKRIAVEEPAEGKESVLDAVPRKQAKADPPGGDPESQDRVGGRL